jgi:hypothetical protein
LTTPLTIASPSWLLDKSTIRKGQRFQGIIRSCKSKKDRQYKKKKEIRTNNERKKHCIKNKDRAPGNPLIIDDELSFPKS